MKHALAPALLAAALSGCASEPVQLESDKTYQVEWLGERPLIERSHLTITLGADGRAYGNAGCNHWFASYSRDGDKLNFGQAGATRKMCAPELMEQEQRFLEALGQIQRWDVSGTDQLRLWPAEGKPIRLSPEEG
ncbi:MULTISPECIES: META domain-containing protein [unclassified Pseudomonas]|uniref:META domain-containing protein n=1 Tax=unclassified Pseudomonas TaxID=196821 RepID=UPI00244A20A1|nr:MULTISPECIES: META domain-containing protein [unclassified Pseudomonas]MDG9924992.1 META domain-containing protein [Pseudomonas sp. GD04045]MDH0036273.1 META domain-containing protein [Pseudomonas sp. GD04019]